MNFRVLRYVNARKLGFEVLFLFQIQDYIRPALELLVAEYINSRLTHVLPQADVSALENIVQPCRVGPGGLGWRKIPVIAQTSCDEVMLFGYGFGVLVDAQATPLTLSI